MSPLWDKYKYSDSDPETDMTRQNIVFSVPDGTTTTSRVILSGRIKM